MVDAQDGGSATRILACPKSTLWQNDNSNDNDDNNNNNNNNNKDEDNGYVMGYLVMNGKEWTTNLVVFDAQNIQQSHIAETHLRQ